MLCQCKRLQWAVATTGLILLAREALEQRWDMDTITNLHFLTSFLKLSTQKIKNIDWGCLNLVKPSYFSYLIRLEIKRQLAKFQPSRVQTSKEEPKTSADLPPPVSSVDNTTTEIIS